MKEKDLEKLIKGNPKLIMGIVIGVFIGLFFKPLLILGILSALGYLVYKKYWKVKK